MERLCRHALLFFACLFLTGVASGEVFDSDGDGDVDLDDFQNFTACLDGPEVEASPSCAATHDGDGDTDVDLFDVSLFQEAFTGPSQAITATQLAGNSLGEYPFFEYVKAFNEDATVEVAIDPTRYPDIVGQTCDIYVVQAKTGSQWWADPSLVDVTPGGPQTETFDGSTIQENTFLVTDPYDLDADAGIGLGVGYDVVLDCDQNGELGNGDYVDGWSNEAGLYVVHDTTQPGPLAVTEILYSVGTVFGIPSYCTSQNTVYPTDIASLGQLPLIVISHGGGAILTWYGHLADHFASYGYIVMSHDNNDGPGVQYASLTTLGHTEAIIDQQGTISGGVLEGHIDSNRIIWIGHGRGGEGVVRAYDRVYTGEYTPTNFTLEDIFLVSSMAPTNFLGPSQSNPHNVPYCLWTASGDADVSGSPANDITQTFPLHDRATGFRHSIVLQGVGHTWFHSGGGSGVFTGPCGIGEEATHAILKGYFLPLLKYYTEGNIPATDFFWRQHERFKPIGVPTGDFCPQSGGDSVVVTKTYHNGAPTGNFVIDDYQYGDEGMGYDDPAISSSGGAVTYTVQNLYEGRLDDNNSSFTWTSSDPMNGMIYAGPDDVTRGVVFDWNGTDCYYQQEIIPDQRNISPYAYLSFRASQGTRHPYTIAWLEDLTFTVTLRDGLGTASSINIGAYGGGIEEPYLRSGGWFNEMETIRIRLTDYLNNGSGLDLTDIVAVRFNFGPSWGSAEGRLVMDDIELTSDHPANWTPLTMSLPDEAPELLSPGAATVIALDIDEGSDTLAVGSALLHYRYDDGTFLIEPLTQISETVWQATLPPPDCGDTPEFYFSAEGEVTGVVYQPAGAPGSTFAAYVGTHVTVLQDDFEDDLGWTVENIDLSGGAWERAIPSTDGSFDEPLADYDGSGHCYVTENNRQQDVDGGPTMLISPSFDLGAASAPVLRYARWWANDDQDGDPMDVEVSNDDGNTWVMVEHVTNIPPGWVFREVNIAEFITASSQVRVRFSVIDNPNNSIDEGGVDTVEVFDVECE